MSDRIPELPPELQDLRAAVDDLEHDAAQMVEGLSAEQGAWQREPTSWSISQCLDHLAVANREYLEAMHPPAERALERGQTRRGPARPGLIGRWFVSFLEPPPARWMPAPAPSKIVPKPAPPLDQTHGDFVASLALARDFIDTFHGIDLAGTRFPNPLVPGIRFSLATGLHILSAHGRRHLQQAGRVREAMEARQ